MGIVQLLDHGSDGIYKLIYKLSRRVSLLLCASNSTNMARSGLRWSHSFHITIKFFICYNLPVTLIEAFCGVQIKEINDNRWNIFNYRRKQDVKGKNSSEISQSMADEVMVWGLKCITLNAKKLKSWAITRNLDKWNIQQWNVGWKLLSKGSVKYQFKFSNLLLLWFQNVALRRLYS